ncbi:MAG: hypothetical protein KJP07_17595, partial [Desulfatitalea sp.]|nr:hypothetical protein [Desulfatitalea sp.]
PPPQVMYRFNLIDQIGFIRKPGVQPLGRIFKSQRDKQLISKDDVVYISYAQTENASQFAPGTKMTIYRTMSPTGRERDIKDIGTQHFLLGIAEITRMENDYAMAKVVTSFNAIFINDLVMPYTNKSPDIPVIDSPTGLEGSIISGERHSQLLSHQFVVFIDKGSNNGVMPGNIFEVYQQEAANPSGKKTFMLASVYSGSLLVLHTEPETSTAVITHSVKKIAPGDKIHTQ